MSLMRPSKKSFIQVLWTGIDASIPSLYLFTDNKRYIFNCGEGLQRLFTQRKMKLGKLDRFFFTRYQWSHIGGLPGFLMTLRDLKSGVPLIAKSSQAFNDAGKSVEKENTGIEGEKNCSFELKDKTKTKIGSASKKQLNEEEPSIRPIDIYAPEGIENIIDATDSFLHVDDSDIKLRLNNYDWNKKLQCSEYKDEELTIYSIPIKSKLCMHAEKRQSCLPDTAIDENILSPLNPPSLCYACHLRPFPGKFDAKKAKELGIPVGPIRGNLQKGETVVLDNGKVITPQDVLGPEIPGTVFLIIDCPSTCYIESLINNITLERYKSFENGPHLVMHLTSDNVCGDSKYLEWVNKFPPHTKHIYLKDLAQGSIVYHSQYCKQFMLNRVNAKLFPLTSERIKKDSVNRLDGSVENFMIVKLRELIDKPVKAFDYSETNVQVNYSELMDKVRNSITNMNGNNEKNFNVCKNENYDCDHKQYTEFSLERKSANTSSNNKDSLAISNGKRCHEEALEATSNKKLIIDKSDNDDIIRHSKDTEKQTYPKIVCLGTGASLPSKYRNVSSTLVFLSEKDIVLLDCGEGTYGQMVRHYGESVNGILSKIKLIFISHMHADHHLGLITLINKLNSLKRICDDSSAVIMAPWLLCKWLSKYKRISEPLKFKFIDFKNSSISKNIHVKPVKVDHPGIAHGVVISYDDLKITYSGDTGPCNALVEAGMNSTLLIHEATLEDEMAEDAREMKHSTTSQAVEVAHKMKAQYVLFTHFSQRYPKIPVIRNELLLSRAAFAFDHMEVTLDDIRTFPELIPTITALYSDENEDMKGLEGLE